MNLKNGVADLIYDVEYYDKVNTFTSDIPFYLELAKQANGPILELCCGTGRITMEIAKNGLDITGLDFTKSMLDGAKKKSKDNNFTIPFELGDMRDFTLNKKYNLVFIPFNSIQNTYSRIDYENIFKCVKKHLNENGIFALDVFNPDLNYLVRDESELEEIHNFSLSSGEKVIIKQTMKYDEHDQINHVKWHHFIDGQEHIAHLDMRCFFPQELDMLLHYNGFEIISKYGNFEKDLFESKSPKQIYVCRIR